MAVRTRSRMRTSEDNGHFHYIDEIDSSGNGSTKMWIDKKTKAKHVHEIRAFVIMITHGHTHRLRGDGDGGGMLAQAPGAEDITERRKERQSLPRGFPDRRGDSGLRRATPRPKRRY